MKEECEKVGLKLNIQKTQIKVSGPFMGNGWVDNGTSVSLLFWAPK